MDKKANKISLVESAEKLYDFISIASASLSRAQGDSTLKLIYFMTYFALNSREKKLQNDLFVALPNPEIHRKAWNFQDASFISMVESTKFATIQTNFQIIIPQLQPRITLDTLNSGGENNNKEGPKNQGEKAENQSAIMFGEQLPFGFVFDHLSQVKVRILAPFNLNDGKSRNKLIMHMHGGGFISGSAKCHQKYTRNWANQTDSLIVSVDYRLAPENPFPAALNDCWQVYFWLLSNAEQFLGIKPENVVLTGDSAGAHLACTVTILAILRQVRVPTGLMLSYGIYDFDFSKFYPSDLFSVDDPILTLGYT